MLYSLFEMNQAALAPMRAAADLGQIYFRNPLNPLANTPVGKNMAALFEMVERVTRRYGKPDFGIDEIRHRRRHGARDRTYRLEPSVLQSGAF